MKKKLSTLLAFVLVIALSVAGTYAYLTDEETVTNTFTVGNVAITLDEADVNPDGTIKGADRVTANEYHLLPGHEYIKDPTVHVDAKSEECFLFVTVDNGIADIEAEGNTTIAAQMAAKGWKAVDGVANAFVYVGTAEATAPLAVEAGANVVVFENFVIADNVDNSTLATYEGETVTVKAYAVQTDTFENTAAETIWTTVFAA